jgi:hypothetical protein
VWRILDCFASVESNWGGVSFKSLQNMLCCNIGGTLCAKKSKNAKQKNERMSKVCRYQNNKWDWTHIISMLWGSIETILQTTKLMTNVLILFET